MQERILITIHLLHLQAGADQDMDMQSSRTANMHTVAHWDCRTMLRKSNDVVAQQTLALELVGHKRMLRSQCLESKLYINNPKK